MVHTEPPSPGATRLLRSWKEIAAHLHVDVRTAQRWAARTAIPIHNQPIGSRSHPVAYTDELDRWITNQARADEAAPAVPRPRRRRRIAIVCMLLALVVLMVAVYVVPSPPAPNPMRVTVEAGTLNAFSADNRLLWQRRLPGSGRIYGGTPVAAADPAAVADLDGDGRADVLVHVTFGPHGEAARLVAYRHDGATLWEHPFDRSPAFRGRTFDARFAGCILRVVEARGRRFVLSAAVHELWFPTQVVLLDAATGHLVDRYWHLGSLLFCLLHDVDADGDPEAVMTGLSNPGDGLGHGALVVLKVPFSREPASRPGVDDLRDDDVVRFTGGKEAAYALFPRPDVCSVLGELPWLADPVMTDGGLRVRTRCGNASVFRVLDASLRTRELRFSDNFATLHRQLERTGQIDHAFSADERACLAQALVSTTAIDGNDPRLAARWRGCE